MNVPVSNSHVALRNNSGNVDNEVAVVQVMSQILSVVLATSVAVAQIWVKDQLLLLVTVILLLAQELRIIQK